MARSGRRTEHLFAPFRPLSQMQSLLEGCAGLCILDDLYMAQALLTQSEPHVHFQFIFEELI